MTILSEEDKCMKKRTVLFLITACLTALFITVSASAATEVARGTCGENLTWVLDSEGTLTIEGSGAMDNWPDDAPPWDSYYADIRTVSLPKGLTSVGDYAFYYCNSLTSINFPDGLEHIGKGAFESCTALEFLPLPDTVTSIGQSAFFDCDALESVVIPAGVTEIPWGAFYDCSNLRSVTISKGVESIGNYAFFECSSLTDITISDTVTSIGEYAFYHCGSLTSVDIPESVSSIGMGAFYDCDALADVTISEGVASIGDYAFYDCDDLASFLIPEGVESIGMGAFYHCDDLITVILPESIESIAADTFTYCFALTDVYFYGTEAQWQEIVPDASVVFSNSSDITFHYNVFSLTQHPEDVTATDGDEVSFSVKARGSNLTYQWQFKAPGTDEWKDSSAASAKTATLSITAQEKYNGYQYRCEIMGGTIIATSDAATLTVKPAVAITQQPEDVTVKAGGKATFSVAAKGSNLTYQWQFKESGSGKTWKNNSCKTATFTLDNVSANNINRNGYQYRCKVTGGTTTVISDAATLTVITETKPAITAQPQPVSVAPDGTAKFTVTATGGSLKYQWQYKAPGKGWVNNSCKTATFTINAPKDWRDGYQYRCKVTNSVGTVTSAPAILTVTTATEELKITAQPKSISVAATDTAKFTVKATGTDLTYQWQFKAPGAKWVNNTCTKATLTINPAKLWRDGYRYRCLIMDADGNVLISSVAALTVN